MYFEEKASGYDENYGASSHRNPWVLCPLTELINNIPTPPLLVQSDGTTQWMSHDLRWGLVYHPGSKVWTIPCGTISFSCASVLESRPALMLAQSIWFLFDSFLSIPSFPASKRVIQFVKYLPTFYLIFYLCNPVKRYLLTTSLQISYCNVLICNVLIFFNNNL